MTHVWAPDTHGPFRFDYYNGSSLMVTGGTTPTPSLCTWSVVGVGKFLRLYQSEDVLFTGGGLVVTPSQDSGFVYRDPGTKVPGVRRGPVF